MNILIYFFAAILIFIAVGYALLHVYFAVIKLMASEAGDPELVYFKDLNK